ncbi:MAG: alpha-2-macroglobulin family protein [bacterium]|nr:alpha-2-macroglobulin family protein [bacterium]
MKKKQPNIKKINFDFEAELKKVDSLIAVVDQPMTAQNLLNQIKNKAAAEQQSGYYVRCVLYQFLLNNQTKEADDTTDANWLLVNKEIANSGNDIKTFLQIAAADLLCSNFENKRWQNNINSNDNSANPSNWSLEKLNLEINARLDLAIELSKQVAYQPLYETLIANYKNAYFKLSIQQLITIQAIEILSDISLPNIKDYVQIPGTMALASYDKFIERDFTQTYDPRNEYKLIALYQNLAKSMKQDPNSHIYFENYRLNKLRNQYNSEDTYIQSLTQLYQTNKANANSCLVAESLAKYYQNTDPARAIQIINEAMERHSNFINILTLKYIKLEIERPVLNFQTELINQPGKKMLAKVDYTNLVKVTITAYKIDYLDYLKQTSYNYHRTYMSEEDYVSKYVDSLKPFAVAYTISLPAYSDYKSHSSEIALDSLPAGTYLLTATESDSLFNSTNIAAFGIISISPYVIVKDNNEAILLDAMNGNEYTNVPYTIYKDKGYNSERDQFEKIYTGKTDGKGRIDYGPNQEGLIYSSLYIEIGNQVLNDRLYFQNYATIGATKTPDITIKTITDRFIYRPGQTVYFKCIVYDDKKKTTMANEKIQVRLQDNNGISKGELSLVTNAYGSASGTFTLPKGGFNTGYFNLLVSETYNNIFRSSLSIRVEEYKRPKYAATFIKPDKAFKLYDSVAIKGEAKAFAGYAIQDAKVEYTVIRKLKNSWLYYRIMNFDGETDVTITSGTTKTDKAGQFNIGFKAMPNERLDKKDNPYFTFEIAATITDLNGEVKSCNYEFTMAYTDRQVNITSENQQWLGKPLNFNFSCTNLQDQPLPFTGKITIEKLIKTTEVKRERWWEITDSTTLTEEQYKQLFPEYASRQTLETKAIITTKTLNNDLSTSVSFGPTNQLVAGDYLATVECKDIRGETITSTCNFTIQSNKAGIFKSADGLLVKCINSAAFEPKDKVKFLVGSGSKNAKVYIKIASKRGLILEKIIALNESSQIIEIPVKESDRGNIELVSMMINDYRLYQARAVAFVPYTNKELSLTLSSFRDATEPGAKEKWIVKLKGPAAEKAAMESIATMYDESLDELYSNPDWELKPFSMYWMNSSISSSIAENQFNIKNDNSGWSVYPPIIYIPSLKLFNDNNGWVWNFGVREDETSRVTRGGSWKNNSYAFSISNNIGYKDKADYDSDGVPAGLYTMKFDVQEEKAPIKETTPVNIRKNFNETVFFYPHLYANKKGEISLEFTMPEALTKWKMRMLSHSTTLQTGFLKQSITTSKKIMVQPNVPRFLRQGDAITIVSKIINTTNVAAQAKVNFSLIDEATGLPLKWLTNAQEQTIALPANGTVPVSFNLQIPQYTGIVTLAITANTGTYSDGEQHTLPVLTNQILITESLPLTIRKEGQQNLEFKSIKNKASSTLVHEKLSVEMSTNPAWYAVMALPYMMEFPNECAEQTFSRLYANSIGTYLAKSNPDIKKVYDTWQRQAETGKGLQSKLLQNQDLKTTVIEETPWLSEANSETEHMQRLGALFNMEKMNEELQTAFEKLKTMQYDDGSFGWFAGMKGNTHITQTIVIGFGKMKKMGVDISSYQSMIDKAMKYLDKDAERDYQIYHADKKLSFFTPINIQYLYSKSFFPNIGLSPRDSIVTYYLNNAEKTWTGNNLLNRAQLASALKVLKPESNVPALILKSFVETAKQTEEMGMYWSTNKGGYYWHEAVIETQAAIIEFFASFDSEKKAIKEQQIWLLRQKQTSHWASTRSTADACYSLLMNGQFLNNQQQVNIRINTELIQPETVQAGTGYFRVNLPKAKINNNSGNIQVNAMTNDFAYGAVYWQYFEQMDKVQKNEQNQLSITKQIYKIMHTETGDQKRLITDGKVDVGDLIEVSLQIRCDRNMEFVHIKDLRASGTEPFDVLSEYKWLNNLGYYQVTKDASTNFFIDYLAKGIYQINYTLKVEQAGEFNIGLATAQCMYAPEYTTHSVNVLPLKVK